MPRRSHRVQLDTEVRLRRSTDIAYQVRLRDVSLHGCSIELINAVSVDERLWIKLPGLEPVESIVRWVEGFKAGVDFFKPLHPAVLDMLRQKHGS